MFLDYHTKKYIHVLNGDTVLYKEHTVLLIYNEQNNFFCTFIGYPVTHPYIG